jgi:Flp pilus assembly secretin CpaC
VRPGRARVSTADFLPAPDPPLVEEAVHETGAGCARDCDAAQSSKRIEGLTKAAEHLESAGLNDLASDLRRRANDERQSQRKLLNRKLEQLTALQGEIAQLRKLIGGEQQIQLQLQVIEYDPERLKDLGISFETISLDARLSQTASNGQAPSGFRGPPLVQTLKDNSKAFRDLLRVLQNAGAAKSLGEPILTVVDGHTASFIVGGGEYPIFIPADGDGFARLISEKREYGIHVVSTPTLTADNNVRLRLQPSVTYPNFKNSVELAGGSIPGLTTARINSEIEAAPGETVLIAGFPCEDNAKRLLMLLTPELVKPFASLAQPPAPPPVNVCAPNADACRFPGEANVGEPAND